MQPNTRKVRLTDEREKPVPVPVYVSDAYCWTFSRVSSRPMGNVWSKVDKSGKIKLITLPHGVRPEPPYVVHGKRYDK